MAKHRAAIERLGVTPLHRLSFAPLAKYTVTPRAVPQKKSGVQSIELPVGYPQKRIRGPRKVALIFSGDTAPDSSVNPDGDTTQSKPMTTRQIGDKGEQAAADWLAADGHEIIARNWRTRYCEIDIVSVKGEVLYFTEVKYRKNDDFGDGLAAITAKKQRQMRFAAELFLAGKPECSGMAAKLLAASVSGDPPAVQAVVEVN